MCRPADRLKQRFPRLPLCLFLDGLFAGGPTFTRCEQYGWKYLITLQDGDLPSVHQDFEALTQLAPENRLHAKVFYFLLQIAHLLSQLTHAVQCSRGPR